MRPPDGSDEHHLTAPRSTPAGHPILTKPATDDDELLLAVLSAAALQPDPQDPA